jgi:flagellar hook-associated protein 1 FlgK
MSGLTAAFWTSAQSLEVNSGALDVTSNNIANANTPGYSREQVEISEASPTVEGNITYGGGAVLEGVQSIRSQVLQLQIDSATQQQSSSQAQYSALQQVQQPFASTTDSVGTNLSAFFSSLSQLSTDPTSVPERQAVLTAAQNTAVSFQQTEQSLQSVQSGLNQTVGQTVSQINSLTQQIAQVNGKVGQMEKLGEDTGSLGDQENQLISQLSQLTDVQVIQTEQGQTITTSGGAPLVVGSQSYSLQSSSNASGMTQVLSQGQNITSSFQGGSLAGTIQVRDHAIPGILTQLDNLASQFSSSVNSAQAAGFDLNGNAGQPLFTDTSGAGAASNLQVAITDPSLIAASSDGSVGSNGNVANLLAVQTTALPSGANPVDTYANLVSLSGNLTAQANADTTANTASLTQLNDQRGALSGVSVDQETANLVNFQNAYQAAAKVVSTIDTLMQTVLVMGTAAAE